MSFIRIDTTHTRAGDPSDGIVRADALGGPPYCFRLNPLDAEGAPHGDGAMSAIVTYKPWWRDVKQRWNPDIEQEREAFQRWTLKHVTKDRPTHVALNKGSLYIPLGPEEQHFLKAYAKMLVAGHQMYFVEQLTYATEGPVCSRLFMDLDFKQLRGVTERGIEAAAMVVSKTVHRFFGIQSTTIVCSTTYKTEYKTDPSGNKIAQVKTGVHLHWPNFYVTSLQALHIRESVLVDLTEAFGHRDVVSMNSWDDVVDQSVYSKVNGGGGSGLRMLGSYKTEKCDKCKNKKRVAEAPCDECLGNGYVICKDDQGRPGRPYMMLCVLGEPNAEGHIERDLHMEMAYKNDMHRLILDTKIRTERTEATLHCGFDLPTGAPTYMAEVGNKRKHSAIARNERVVDPKDSTHAELQKVIREAFGPLYAHIMVTKIAKTKAQYTVSRVTGLNCKYCQNIGREHVSNNIYFVVTKNGVTQRCYDTGGLTPEMKHGICKEYASSEMPLPLSSISILWPEMNDTLTAFTANIEGPEKNIYNSFAMKTLLNAGEYLATTLYNVSWTSTLGLQGFSKGRNSLKEYLPQDTRNLGSKGIEAYRDLGLAWADALVDHVRSSNGLVTSASTDDLSSGPSIQELSKNLWESFDLIVGLACTVRTPEIFVECKTLDDYYENFQET